MGMTLYTGLGISSLSKALQNGITKCHFQTGSNVLVFTMLPLYCSCHSSLARLVRLVSLSGIRAAELCICSH